MAVSEGGLPSGVSAQGVCVCPGGCLPGGWGEVSAQGGLPDPPGTEFLTHTCENITFRQLPLRTVTITISFLGDKPVADPGFTSEGAPICYLAKFLLKIA